MQLFLRALFVFLVSSPATAVTDVLVVAADGSGDFTDLPLAVGGAAAGDTLLVKAGTYSGFSVTGKGLVITAELGATPVVAGKVTVAGVGGGATLVLDGLSVTPAAGRAFEASSCAGTLWLEDCTLLAGPGFPTLPFDDCVGIDVDDCDAVVLLRTVATAGDSFGLLPNGLQANDSEVHAYDCTFTGDLHSPGGRGASLDGGFLFASGTTFRGGDGEDGSGGPFGGCDGENGGHALQLVNATADTMDCTFEPGQGGLAFGGCFDGSDGEDVSTLGSTHTTIAGFARSFAVDSPIREGNDAVLSYAGKDGDLVIALFSLAVQPSYDPALRGTLLPAFPPALFTLGVAVTGSLTVNVPVGPLPVGLDSLAVPLQAGVVTSTGALVLGAGTKLVVLDGAF